GGVSRLLIGSVAERTLREAKHAVLTVHEDGGSLPIRRIVVPVDVAHSDLEGLPRAEKLRADLDAELDFVYVFRDPQRLPIVTWKHLPSVKPAEFYDHARKRARENLEALVAERIAVGPRHHFHAIMGVPHDEIVRHAAETKADLILMSTHGRTGLAHTFLGSVAERVVRSAPCPVWTFHREPREESA
ncbi:MAG: universal stress protein, partial [Planctomycetes bacterium]|nr:universal stress protein [Planctomycetota bacterium]